MSETAKYLPKTIASLAKLQETTALLENNADFSITDKKEIEDKLSFLRSQIEIKVAVIDNIINTLNGAIK